MRLQDYTSKAISFAAATLLKKIQKINKFDFSLMEGQKMLELPGLLHFFSKFRALCLDVCFTLQIRQSF